MEGFLKTINTMVMFFEGGIQIPHRTMFLFLLLAPFFISLVLIINMSKPQSLNDKEVLDITKEDDC